MPLPKSKYQGPRRGGMFAPIKLELCRGCKQYIYQDSEICHFCGADVNMTNGAFLLRLAEAREAALQVDLILRRMQREKMLQKK